jgi:Protein of unknown function (DUF1353)
MPFVALRQDPNSAADVPPAPLQLGYFSAREITGQSSPDQPIPATSPRWQLRTPFGYVAEDGRYFEVPAHTGSVTVRGNSTDLASVPSFLWGILAPYGRQLRPALLHDHRLDVADGRVSEDPGNRDAAGRPVAAGRKPVQLREEADYLIREALRAEGVGVARSWLFWTGVSFGRFLQYTRLRGVVLGLLAALASVLALHAVTVALGGGPRRVDGWWHEPVFWLAMLGIAVLLAVLRRKLLALTVPLSLITIVACLSGAGPGAPRLLHSLGYHALAAGVLLAAAAGVGLVTDVRVAILALVVTPLILPVIILTTLVQVTLALPDLIWWAARGYRGDVPVIGPLLAPVRGGL